MQNKEKVLAVHERDTGSKYSYAGHKNMGILFATTTTLGGVRKDEGGSGGMEKMRGGYGERREGYGEEWGVGRKVLAGNIAWRKEEWFGGSWGLYEEKRVALGDDLHPHANASTQTKRGVCVVPQATGLCSAQYMPVHLSMCSMCGDRG